MLAKLRNAVRQRVKRHYDVPEIAVALERLLYNNFYPRHIFDVGAHAGEFARLCRRIWPSAKLTCFEVLPHRVEELKSWSKVDGNAEIIECLLGAEPKMSVRFHEMETASSVLEEHVPQSTSFRSYEMRTIDQIVANSRDSAPSLLKLDVQGYEFEVLNGAQAVLPKVEVILVEVNFIDIHKRVHLFDDIIVFLRDQDFLAYDICGIHRRPLDSALWQADFIFVPRNSSLRANKRWKS